MTALAATLASVARAEKDALTDGRPVLRVQRAILWFDRHGAHHLILIRAKIELWPGIRSTS